MNAKILRLVHSPVLLLLLLLSAAAASQQTEDDPSTGKVVASSVVALTEKDFNSSINDPKQPFWLLKFFAPWCGHCKRLAPVLDKVAPKTPHMKIGTIDCTVEKTLCNRFKVRGYPTLKYSIDGEIIDYPGGRGEGDLMSFARRMEGPAISLVPSLATALAVASDGVAFIAYHPAVVTAFNLDGKIASSRLTQVFGQAARKLQATGTFTILDTSHAESDEEAAAVASTLGEGPYICRLENEVKPRCYYKISDSMTADPLMDWIKRENYPTVSTVGATNFNKLSRNGKPLCLAIVKRDAAEATSILKKYAINVPSSENYVFGTVDGVHWKRFIEQFGVNFADLPQLLLLDSPKKLYWHNATYNLEVERFLRDVESGVIEKKSSGKGGAKGFLQNVIDTLNKYEPYASIAFLCTILLILVGTVYLCCFRATKPPSSKKHNADTPQPESETKKDK